MRIVASITSVHWLSLKITKYLWHSSCHWDLSQTFGATSQCHVSKIWLVSVLYFDVNIQSWPWTWTLFDPVVGTRCTWKRLDDSCWLLTDSKGTSSVLYDVNKKKPPPSIFNKEERLWLLACLHICTWLTWVSEFVKYAFDYASRKYKKKKIHSYMNLY